MSAVLGGCAGVAVPAPEPTGPGTAGLPVPGYAPYLTGGIACDVPQSDLRLACDRLSLMFPVMAESDVVDLFGSGVRSEGVGRNRGPIGSRTRYGWLPGWDGAKFFVSWVRYANGHQAELRVDFSPAVQTRRGVYAIGSALRAAGVDPLRCWVERFDAAFTLTGPTVRRERFVLDPGAFKLSMDGCTSRGPETETVGKGWDHKFQAQLYDKRAERVVKGFPDPGPSLRFEVRRRGPCSLVGESEPRSVRLSELGSVEWPIPPSVCVREFVYAPDDYQDDRYCLLSSAARIYGTRHAERASAAVLSGLHPAVRRERLRFCAWPEFEPSFPGLFARYWPRAVASVAADLCGGAA